MRVSWVATSIIVPRFGFGEWWCYKAPGWWSLLPYVSYDVAADSILFILGFQHWQVICCWSNTLCTCALKVCSAQHISPYSVQHIYSCCTSVKVLHAKTCFGIVLFSSNIADKDAFQLESCIPSSAAFSSLSSPLVITASHYCMQISLKRFRKQVADRAKAM